MLLVATTVNTDNITPESLVAHFDELCYSQRKSADTIVPPDGFTLSKDVTECSLYVTEDFDDLDGLWVRTLIQHKYDVVYGGISMYGVDRVYEFRFKHSTDNLSVIVRDIANNGPIIIKWSRY